MGVERFHITSPEIYAMYGAAKGLIAAPGTGLTTIIYRVWARYNFATTNYSVATQLMVSQGYCPILISDPLFLSDTVGPNYAIRYWRDAPIEESWPQILENQETVLAIVGSNAPEDGDGSVDIWIDYETLKLEPTRV